MYKDSKILINDMVLPDKGGQWRLWDRFDDDVSSRGLGKNKYPVG